MLRPGHFVRLITSNLLATADFVVCELVTLKVAAAERSARPVCPLALFGFLMFTFSCVSLSLDPRLHSLSLAVFFSIGGCLASLLITCRSFRLFFTRFHPAQLTPFHRAAQVQSHCNYIPVFIIKFFSEPSSTIPATKPNHDTNILPR